MQEFIVGFEYLAIYFVTAATSAILIRKLFPVPHEVFRKILHGIVLGSLLVFTFGFSTWWKSAVASVIFAIIIYPVLALAERWKGYSDLLTERKTGEIKTSLLLVFAMFAVVISVCWGWLGDRMLLLASIYAWGFGDAVAALVGKKFGVHKITGKFQTGKKSYEGTISMFVTSFLCVFIIMMLRGGLAWYECLIIAFFAGGVSAVTELYTSNGFDTVTCPISAMLVILPLTYLFGGI